jgi:hypothetical protein
MLAAEDHRRQGVGGKHRLDHVAGDQAVVTRDRDEVGLDGPNAGAPQGLEVGIQRSPVGVEASAGGKQGQALAGQAGALGWPREDQGDLPEAEQRQTRLLACGEGSVHVTVELA